MMDSSVEYRFDTIQDRFGRTWMTLDGVPVFTIQASELPIYIERLTRENRLNQRSVNTRATLSRERRSYFDEGSWPEWPKVWACDTEDENSARRYLEACETGKGWHWTR